MIWQLNEVFTVEYGLDYDKWVTVDVKGLEDTYTRGTYTIKLRRNDFPNLFKVYNASGKMVYNNYIYTISDYKKMKKKLKWT